MLLTIASCRTLDWVTKFVTMFARFGSKKVRLWGRPGSGVAGAGELGRNGLAANRGFRRP